jgi:hypothetical protein
LSARSRDHAANCSRCSRPVHRSTRESRCLMESAIQACLSARSLFALSPQRPLYANRVYDIKASDRFPPIMVNGLSLSDALCLGSLSNTFLDRVVRYANVIQMQNGLCRCKQEQHKHILPVSRESACGPPALWVGRRSRPRPAERRRLNCRPYVSPIA